MVYKYECEEVIKNVIKEVIYFKKGKNELAEKEIDDIYAKAKAWEELKKYIDEEVDSYMTLYRETKDPAYSLLNSHYDTLLGYMEELERADDEKI